MKNIGKFIKIHLNLSDFSEFSQNKSKIGMSMIVEVSQSG